MADNFSDRDPTLKPASPLIDLTSGGNESGRRVQRASARHHRKLQGISVTGPQKERGVRTVQGSGDGKPAQVQARKAAVGAPSKGTQHKPLSCIWDAETGIVRFRNSAGVFPSALESSVRRAELIPVVNNEERGFENASAPNQGSFKCREEPKRPKQQSDVDVVDNTSVEQAILDTRTKLLERAREEPKGSKQNQDVVTVDKSPRLEEAILEIRRRVEQPREQTDVTSSYKPLLFAFIKEALERYRAMLPKEEMRAIGAEVAVNLYGNIAISSLRRGSILSAEQEVKCRSLVTEHVSRTFWERSKAISDEQSKRPRSSDSQLYEQTLAKSHHSLRSSTWDCVSRDEPRKAPMSPFQPAIQDAGKPPVENGSDTASICPDGRPRLKRAADGRIKPPPKNDTRPMQSKMGPASKDSESEARGASCTRRPMTLVAVRVEIVRRSDAETRLQKSLTSKAIQSTQPTNPPVKTNSSIPNPPRLSESSRLKSSLAQPLKPTMSKSSKFAERNSSKPHENHQHEHFGATTNEIRSFQRLSSASGLDHQSQKQISRFKAPRPLPVTTPSLSDYNDRRQCKAKMASPPFSVVIRSTQSSLQSAPTSAKHKARTSNISTNTRVFRGRSRPPRTSRSLEVVSITSSSEDTSEESIRSVPEDSLGFSTRSSSRLNLRKRKRSPSPKTSVEEVSLPLHRRVQLRELGIDQSRRGEYSARKALQDIQVEVSDSLKPWKSWVLGGSSDVVSVSWSPDGDVFAAGCAALTDTINMQYNRGNNLLMGSSTQNILREIPDHRVVRHRPSSGPNSTQTMVNTMSPWLYQTVSSVCFSASGREMYTASYDKTVKVWDIDVSTARARLFCTLRHEAAVDIVTPSRRDSGVIATGSKTEDSGVRVYRIGHGSPDSWPKYEFSSIRAARSQKKLYPSCIQWGSHPVVQHLVLAGFTTHTVDDYEKQPQDGDICLFDVEKGSAIKIKSGGQNVFDCVWHPTLPQFAAGCVADSHANRGSRSYLRLYSAAGMQIHELECSAVDMNEITWCPDEYYCTASCTDGKTYVWDLRTHARPMHVLKHGEPIEELPVMNQPRSTTREMVDTGVRFAQWGSTTDRFYTGSSDGVVKVWNIKRSQEDVWVQDLIQLESGVMCGAFSADHSKLLLGDTAGQLKILATQLNGQEVDEGITTLDYEGVTEGPTDPVQPTKTDQYYEASLGMLERGEMIFDSSKGIRQAIRGPNYNGPWAQDVLADASRRQQEREHRRFLAGKPSKWAKRGVDDATKTKEVMTVNKDAVMKGEKDNNDDDEWRDDDDEGTEMSLATKVDEEMAFDYGIFSTELLPGEVRKLLKAD